MLGKVSGLLTLAVVLLSIISPVNLTSIHLSNKNKVLAAFDVCHASGPLQPANADAPSYTEQICCSLSVPGFAGFYTASRALLNSSLIAFQIEIPPRA
jgi:hypothetical protein